MVQQRMALVTQKVEVEERRIIGIPVEQWTINANGMVIKPSVLCVQMEPIEWALDRGICHDLVIGFEEARIPDAKRHLPATVVEVWRCHWNGSPVEPAKNETSHIPGLAAAKVEFNLKQMVDAFNKFHTPDNYAGQFGEIV